MFNWKLGSFNSATRELCNFFSMRNGAIITLRLLRIKLERKIYIKRSTATRGKLSRIHANFSSRFIESGFSRDFFSNKFFAGMHLEVRNWRGEKNYLTSLQNKFAFHIFATNRFARILESQEVLTSLPSNATHPRSSINSEFFPNEMSFHDDN